MATLPEGAIPVNTDIPKAPTPQILPIGANPLPTWLAVQSPPSTPTAPPPSFVSDVQSRLQGRQREVSQTIEDTLKGNLGLDTAAIQVMGKGVAGTVTDVTGAALQAAWRGFSDFIPTNVSDKAAEGFAWLASSVPAQEAFLVARRGADAYAGWKERNPQDAKTLESIVDIGAVINPGRPGTPTFAAKSATALERSAIQGRKGFVTELVLPLRTKKVRMEEVPRTTISPMLKYTPTPTALEQGAINEVSLLTGVSGSRSAQYNYNVIRDANRQKAETLILELEKANIPVDAAAVARQMDTDVQKLIKNSAYITGDLEATANKVKDYATTLFAASDGTAAGLLKTRKEFDRWVSSQKGGDPLDATGRQGTLKAAVQQVRNTLNDALDAAAPNQAVKKSLKSQHNLYVAMDNVQEKAAEEASKLLGRVYQNIHKATGGNLPTTPLALAATGAAAYGAIQAGWLPYALAPLVYLPITVAVYKGAASPALRQQLAGLFKNIDVAIKATKIPDLKVSLATDRLALLELLKQLPVEKEETKQ